MVYVVECSRQVEKCQHRQIARVQSQSLRTFIRAVSVKWCDWLIEHSKMRARRILVHHEQHEQALTTSTIIN